MLGRWKKRNGICKFSTRKRDREESGEGEERKKQPLSNFGGRVKIMPVISLWRKKSPPGEC